MNNNDNLSLLNDMCKKYRWGTMTKSKIKKILNTYPSAVLLSNKLKEIDFVGVDKICTNLKGLDTVSYILYIQNSLIPQMSVNKNIRSILG